MKEKKNFVYQMVDIEQWVLPGAISRKLVNVSHPREHNNIVNDGTHLNFHCELSLSTATGKVNRYTPSWLVPERTVDDELLARCGGRLRKLMLYLSTDEFSKFRTVHIYSLHIIIIVINTNIFFSSGMRVIDRDLY